MVGLQRLTPGSVFAGCFEVLDVLAEGGMGTVYAVTDRTTGEPRALKVLLPELTADETSRRRFAQEGLMASQLQSPYAVRVHGVGVDAQTSMPWIAMDLLRGRDLRAQVREHGAMSLAEARPILEQLGEGLAAAHARGWVHRDLKPENIFLDMATGVRRVKLLDFGVAKMIDLHRTSATGTGAIGSPLWMSPEQTSAGGRIAPATDVFAYGLVAFYVLSGTYYWHSAHDDAGVGGLLRELHVDPIEAPSVRARKLRIPEPMPAGFDEWFMRAVARDPLERFRHAADALAALRPVLATANDHADAYAQTIEVPTEHGRSSTRPMGSVTPNSARPSSVNTLPMGAVAPSVPPTEGERPIVASSTPRPSPPSYPPSSPFGHPPSTPSNRPSGPGGQPASHPSSHPPTGGNASIRALVAQAESSRPIAHPPPAAPQPPSLYGQATSPSYAPPPNPMHVPQPPAMPPYAAHPHAMPHGMPHHPPAQWQPPMPYPFPEPPPNRWPWIVFVLVVGIAMAGLTAVIVWVVLTISTGRAQAPVLVDPLSDSRRSETSAFFSPRARAGSPETRPAARLRTA